MRAKLFCKPLVENYPGPKKKEITVHYEQGTTHLVSLHNGSVLHLHKSDNSFDVTKKRAAVNALEHHREKGQIPTGILHVNETLKDTHDILDTTDKPLNTLTKKELYPGNQTLQKIFENYR